MRLSGAYAAPAAETELAQDALRASLGTDGIVDPGRVTGTPRVVAKLDGALTPPSTGAPADIALDYVRAHATAFGTDDADLDALRLTQAYTDIGGTTHLIWAQTYRGIPVFDNDLRANVASDGRLINVLGSPASRLAVRSVLPRVTASEARAATLASVGAPSIPAAAGDRAALVLFTEPHGVRLAWDVVARGSPATVYRTVVDARSGEVLWRANLVASAGGAAWEYYPSDLSSCAAGCRQRPVSFPGSWATASGRLSGNNAHVFADVDDDDRAGTGEEVPPSGSGPTWSYAFRDFNADNVFLGNCSSHWPCSWKSDASTWQTNLRQDAVQAYYYVNRFHDHLLAPPIGFDEAAGNFQQVNASGRGKGGDAVVVNTDDGARTGPGGVPDANHLNNANMLTFGDGHPPRMQMYLFSGNGFITGNGGDDASVVYHEYTHGLSSRLVRYADGSPALSGPQAGAMGEGWSDWYALDYLNTQGFAPDTANPGDVVVGFFVTGGKGIRTEGMDCPVGLTLGAGCPGTLATGPGGYTYGDFGTIAGGPEVHADGEIWAQTLWQLRQELGSAKTEALVTRAMPLAPANPSFLDMRNAILQADYVAYRSADRSTIWRVFASRGMGYFASALDGSDVHPVEDFSLPPTAGSATGTVSGRVKDESTGAPVPSAAVVLGSLGTGPDKLTGASDWVGRYSVTRVPPGTYGYARASAAGFDSAVRANVTVAAGPTTIDLGLRRDWAAGPGGAVVTAASGPDYTAYGCGAAGAIDQSIARGWSTSSPFDGNHPGPKAVTVKLPVAVNISSFAVDPGATCGDSDWASTGPYKIETSTDGKTFVAAASGTFGDEDDHRLNAVTPSAGTKNVRYVRFWMVNVQGPSAFMDLSELEVYGSAATPSAITGFQPASGPAGTTVTISGTGFSGTRAVWFNGISASFRVVSGSQITATVPAGATTGKIGVATPAGAVYSASRFSRT